MAAGASVLSLLPHLAAATLLVYLLGRLARAAHKAADMGGTEAPWTYLAGAAGLFAFGWLSRLPRALLSDGPPSVAGLIFVFLIEAGAAILIVRYFEVAHHAHYGQAAPGLITAGVVLVATSLVSVLLVNAAPPVVAVNATAAAAPVTVAPPAALIQMVIAGAFGAFAWALWSAAAFTQAAGRAPSWVPTFARVGAQVLVAGAFVYVLALNAVFAGASGDSLNVVRGFVFATAFGLAGPCLIAAAYELLRDAQHGDDADASAPATDDAGAPGA